MDGWICGIIGAVLGVGGLLVFGWLRGRSSSGAGSAARAVQRAEQAHAKVDADLAEHTADIESDRSRDHAAGDERWGKP